MIIPTSQTKAVFVTFSKDLVRASNNFVIVTPPKLNKEIVAIPKITKISKNVSDITYFKYTKGNSMNASLFSLKTHPLTPKLQGIKDNVVTTIVMNTIPKHP